MERKKGVRPVKTKDISPERVNYLIHVYGGPMTIEEIAGELGVQQHIVNMTLWRAMDKLTKKWGRHKGAARRSWKANTGGGKKKE